MRRFYEKLLATTMMPTLFIVAIVAVVPIRLAFVARGDDRAKVRACSPDGFNFSSDKLFSLARARRRCLRCTRRWD